MGDRGTFRWFFRRVVEKPLVRPYPQRNVLIRTKPLHEYRTQLYSILVKSFINIRVRSIRYEAKLGLGLESECLSCDVPTIQVNRSKLKILLVKF